MIIFPPELLGKNPLTLRGNIEYLFSVGILYPITSKNSGDIIPSLIIH